MAGHRIEDLTWPEVERLARSGAVGLVPLAAVEQHGPHLPTRTDAAIAERLAQMVAERMASPVLIAPVLPGGISPHHAVLPGTIDLPYEVLRGWVAAVRATFVRAGVGRIGLFSSHGGNWDALGTLAPELSDDDARVVAFADGDAYFGAMRGGALDAGLSGLPDTDRHAGAMETSQMLHLIGEDGVGAYQRVDGLVDADEGWRAVMRSRGVTAVSPSGVLGDPRRARAEAGAAIMRALADALAEFFDRRLAGEAP
jgi:creatinine amidohydrolase